MLRLQVEALQVTSFETETPPTKEKERGGTTGPDTRMILCTHCTTCNVTA